MTMEILYLAAAVLLLVVAYYLFWGGGVEFTGEEGPPEMDKVGIEGLEKAYFGLGCFWGVESLFGGVEGVVLTRVGYAGGTKENPAYHSLGGHTETVEVTYDPKETTYEKLLEVFWSAHDPASKPHSRQYMNAVFYADGEQRRKAEASKLEGANTQILPVNEFTQAEDYHQKYHLRHSPLMDDLRKKFSSEEEFINSPAATKANAAAGGHEVDLRQCGL